VDTGRGVIHVERETVKDSLTAVSIEAIETPIGWQDRYTITVGPDKLPEVLSWFRDQRGIAVLQSHYMPSCPTAFCPSDNIGGDWRFNGADKDVVEAKDCDRVFRVVQLETWYDMSIPAECEYCYHGKRTREKNAPLISQSDSAPVCERCNVRIGFSFDEPYHFAGQCDRVPREAAECWVCNGTGIGNRYLSQMKGKEKDAAKRELTRQGWKLHYVNRGRSFEGSYWIGERETVVKDWDETMGPAEVKS